MLTILPQEGQCGIPARKKLKVGRKNRLSATSGESGGGRFLLQAQGGDGNADQLQNARLALLVLDCQGAGSSIANQGLRFSPKLGVEIAAGQLKDRVRRIFFRQGADGIQGALVLLIAYRRAEAASAMPA